MDNVYDLHRHSDCAIIYMGKKHTVVYLCPNLSRSSSNAKNITINKNRVIYNKEKTKVLDWGNAYSYNENKDDVHIENFRDELYEAFKKENSQWGEDDKFLLQTVSDFIHRTVKASMESHITEIVTMDAIHYAFVIPSVWEEDIAKIMIQSIFIRSNLISKDDHSDRLLFFTDIESIFYGFGELNHQGYRFKRGQNTILSQLSLLENSTVSVKLDLISTMNTRFDFDDSKLYPKVVRTTSLVFSYEGIKDSIKLFFESKLFSDGTNAEQDRVMDMVADFKFDIGDLTIDRYDKFKYNEHPFYEYDDDDGDFDGNDDGEDARSITDCTQSKTRWRLNETQKAYIRSVSLIELGDQISESLLESLRDLISNNCVKEYDFLVLQDSYSSSLTYSRTQAMRNFSLISWLKIMLECDRVRLNFMTTVFNPQLAMHPISLGDIVSGASLGVIENVQNSDIYCKPRIVPKKDIPTLSSKYFNARPNSIINIDISYKSTLLSCSILSDGLVTEILDHNYFIAEKCLPSLDSFYEILNETTLNVRERFIPFAETYLLDELNLFLIDNDASVKEEIMREIEAILKRSCIEDEIPVTLRRRDHLKVFLRTYKDYIKESIFKKDPPDHKSSFFEDALVSIRQRKYIKAFFEMYMIYLKELISSKFPAHLQSENTKTGYAVSIEKVLLNNVIGTKEDFEKIVFASGLTRKDDEFQKLRIVTQGEGLLPFIRQSLKLEFPLKSYFVLAQLHEDYIQLTLHQIVTESSPDEHQEEIIFHNETLSIQNIHDNLCLQMWNNIIQNNQLIQLCNEHAASDNNVISELLSLKTKKEFMKNFRYHITSNILSDSSSAKITETTGIQLNESCRCKVYLTTYDILEVSFRPTLQEIACTITTALINKDIFGKYPRIRYHFNLICFNRNLLLQDTLAKMLKEEIDDFNQDQGIETTFFTIPELPHMILHPILNQQPLLYRAFQMGTLHQVFSDDYSFSIGYTPVGTLKFFASQSVDTESYVTKNDVAFSLLKKGGLISNTRSNKIFYFITDQNSCPKKINIGIQKLKEFKGLEHEQFDLIDTAYETIYSRIIYFKKSVIENGNVPIMISVEHQDYCSSLKLSITILDKDINIPNFLQVGEPMTLTRF